MQLEGSGDRSLDTKGWPFGTDLVSWVELVGEERRSKVPEVWSRSLVVGVPAASRLLLEHFKMAQLRGALHLLRLVSQDPALTT